VGVGVQPVLTDHDLALVGNVRGHPGDKLQIIHRLLVGRVLTVSVTDLAFGLQKRQPLQRKHRPEHVLPHPLGLYLRLGPHQAVDIEAGVWPGENALGPLRVQKLLTGKHRQHLAGEDLRQPRVVDPRNLVKDTRLVRPALGHQVMEMGVEINPVPKGLDSRDDAGRKRALSQEFEVSGQGPEGTAAEVPQQPALELEEDSQHLGDGEDDLAMRNIQKERLPHPLAPLLNPLGVTRRTETPRLARKRQSALTLDPENGNGRGHHFIPIPGRVKQ